MPEVVRANIHLSVLMIAEEMAARMTGAGSVGATGSAGQPAEAR
jgi:choline dehydrogenase-like flavoprotein